jgi:phage antirepressor YoqD-like protein
VWKISEADLPVLLLSCELALKRGHTYVHNITANVQSDDLTDNTFKLLSTKVHELCKFLIDHNYMITVTDKNLDKECSYIRESHGSQNTQ